MEKFLGLHCSPAHRSMIENFVALTYSSTWPSIKVQVLVKFILECSILVEEPEEDPPIKKGHEDLWTMHIDGSSNLTRSVAMLILANHKRNAMEYTLYLKFPIINNEAKYEALVIGLKIVKELGAPCLKVHSDLQLVVG